MDAGCEQPLSAEEELVIKMASWLGRHGISHYSGYSATKFAIMTRTLALDIALSGVRAN